MKNLNAIVWLYRGEIDKYQKLIFEYQDDLYSSAQVTWDDEVIEAVGNVQSCKEIKPFAEIYDNITALLEKRKGEAKQAIEAAAKKDKKALQTTLDNKMAWIQKMLTVAKEALWLTEKFGVGEYKDVLGLCYLASRKKNIEDGKTINEFKEKGFSLTPGAYVGVEEVADDGVDFSARMKEIHKELLSLQAQSNDLMSTISKNIKELGL